MTATATRPLLRFTPAQIRSGRSPTRVRQWIKAGRLRPVAVDEHGHHWYDPDDVDRAVAEADRWGAQPEAIEQERAQRTAEREQSAAPEKPAKPNALQAQLVKILMGGES